MSKSVRCLLIELFSYSFMHLYILSFVHEVKELNINALSLLLYAYGQQFIVHYILYLNWHFYSVDFYFLYSRKSVTSRINLCSNQIKQQFSLPLSSPRLPSFPYVPRPSPFPQPLFSAPPFCQPIYNSRACSRPPCHLPFTVTDSSPTHQACVPVSISTVISFYTSRFLRSSSAL